MSAAELAALEPHPLRLEASTGRFWRGGYEGARSRSRELREWQPGLGSATSDTLPDLVEIRARGRDLERNAPIAGALETIVTDTVGRGFLCRPALDAEFLGLSPAQAQATRKILARIWYAFADSTDCDATGRNNFSGLTRTVLHSVLSSGDVLAIRRFRPRPGTTSPLRIQLVEADRVSNPNLAPDRLGLIGGVEMDLDGRPVMYWVRDGHPGDYLLPMAGQNPNTWTGIPAFGAQSGDPLALLVAGDNARPGQVRGVPILAPVIATLKQVTRLTDGELMASVLNSFFTVFIKRNTLGDPALSVGGFQLGGAETAAAERAPRTMKLGSGAIIELEDGESIETADPSRPNANFDPFFQAIVSQIAVAIEMPPEVLLKRFETSYSAARAALLAFWRTILRRRDWLTTQWLQPCYSWRISLAVARGELDAPGFFEDPMIRRAYTAALWVGPPQGQLNPKVETDAAIARVDNFLSDRHREAAELVGEEWEDMWEQQKAERAALRSDGVNPDQPSPGAPAVDSPGGVPGDLRRETPAEV